MNLTLQWHYIPSTHRNPYLHPRPPGFPGGIWKSRTVWVQRQAPRGPATSCRRLTGCRSRCDSRGSVWEALGWRRKERRLYAGLMPWIFKATSKHEKLFFHFSWVYVEIVEELKRPLQEIRAQTLDHRRQWHVDFLNGRGENCAHEGSLPCFSLKQRGQFNVSCQPRGALWHFCAAREHFSLF